MQPLLPLKIWFEDLTAGHSVMSDSIRSVLYRSQNTHTNKKKDYKVPFLVPLARESNVQWAGFFPYLRGRFNLSCLFGPTFVKGLTNKMRPQ